MALLYHITPRSQWAQAQETGVYQAESLATEGFIHCSTISQVIRVANLFYQGQTDLVLLCIAPAKVQAPLRYDPIDTGEAFPHIYGPLNLDAVVQVLDFDATSDGTFTLPSALSSES